MTEEMVWSVDPATGAAVLARKDDDGTVTIEAVTPPLAKSGAMWIHTTTPATPAEILRDLIKARDRVGRQELNGEWLPPERDEDMAQDDRIDENMAWLRLLDALEDIREMATENDHIRPPINAEPSRYMQAMLQRLEEAEFWAHKQNAVRKEHHDITPSDMERARDAIELEDAGPPAPPVQPPGGGASGDVVKIGGIPIVDLNIHHTPGDVGAEIQHRAAAIHRERMRM